MLKMRNITIAALSLFVITTGGVAADERYRPVQDALTSSECGTCHMAFQPQMLPERSWAKIMDTLGDHFGEDASLEAADRDHIKSYLMDNAADSSWLGGKFMRGVKDNMTPLRITEMPYWVHEHNEEVSPRAWSDPKVKTKANCLACHRDANRGNYDD